MKRTHGLVTMMAVLLTVIMVMAPVAAWGASVKVAAVDDETGTNAGYVCSDEMGCVYYSDYESVIPGLDMVTVEPSAVNAATLANYDTLFLFATNPSGFSASQKNDINAFVANGGKLIIWDSEDPGPHGTWNYNWLNTPFATAVPGAQGAPGVLDIVEENMLSSDDTTSPYYINAAGLGTNTDAVGDANVFTSYVPSQWCVDMTADSSIAWMPTGPTHLYTKGTPTGGIVIYDGLDWDTAGYTSGWPSYLGSALELKKIFRNELTASSLPCTAPPVTSLTVTKVADKATYQVGDPVTFTVTVTNPSAYDATNVGLVDYPPAEVALTTTTSNLGTIAAGATKSTTFTGTATTAGCNIKNNVVATGYYGFDPIFTGGDTATFDIGTSCCTGGSCVPEFPSLALPVGMIIGLVFVVYSMRSDRKE